MTDPLSFQDYFEKGEHIIREGEEGNTFFIIAKGQVRLLAKQVAHATFLHCFISPILFKKLSATL